MNQPLKKILYYKNLEPYGISNSALGTNMQHTQYRAAAWIGYYWLFPV